MSNLNIQRVLKSDDRSLPIFEEFDQLAERIRMRAFSLFNGRGGTPGHAMEDWLQAEREICWPAAELTERDDTYELDVALAGFEPDEIDITATPSELIVKAGHESKSKKRKKDDDTKVQWSEFKSENVYRHVDLPGTIDVDKVTAHLENGLLKIKAPKIEEKKSASKQIKVSPSA